MLTKIQMACLTERTQLEMFGKVFRKTYDHSIHPNGRDKARLNTKRQKRTVKGKEYTVPAGTEPAVTRPGKEYPGGRTLRRAYKRLQRRRDSAPKNTRTPGSMKSN